MQRYFVEVDNDVPLLSEEDRHHIIHVMRMKVGECFEVVDSSLVYIYEIESLTPFKVKLIEKKEEDKELEKDITLFFALAKGDKIDLVIQKCTELGVNRIVLFKSKRCVVNFDDKDVSKKLIRYQKIAKEASEQCHRTKIPSIEGVIELKDIDKYLCDINYVAYEKEEGSMKESLSLMEDKNSVSIMIGSEGGFDKSEIEYLKERSFISITLGKRILRCETAAIFSLSALAYEIEK